MGKAKLFPNPFDRACELFNCQTRAEWFVGDPSGPLSNTFRLCTPCAENMLATAPVKLKEGGPALWEQVKAEFEVQKGVFFAEEFQRRAHEVLKQEQEEYFRRQATAPIVFAADEILPFSDDEHQYEPPTPEETTKDRGSIFRCLECDTEFPSKKGLSAHMRTHKED